MGTKASGKQVNQKLKTYLIMQYFLKNSNEEHPLQMSAIRQFLLDDCGIESERRSIYRDIDDINKILYMLDHEDEGCTIQEASDFFNQEGKTQEELEEMEDEKFIVGAGTNRSGYYLRKRPHNIEIFKSVPPKGFFILWGAFFLFSFSARNKQNSVPPEKFSKSVTRFVTQKRENPRKLSVFGGFGGD